MTDRDTIHSRLPRVYAGDAALQPGGQIALDEAQAHHLRQVLRLADGEAVRVFNSRDGEFLGSLRHSGKRGAVVEIGALLRAALTLPDIWLVAPPLKKDALDVMVEKASELGALRFMPVLTDHTAVHRINAERLLAQAVDAAEQCERFDVMAIDALQPLSQVLANWPQERRLFVALERSAAPPFLRVLQEGPLPGSFALLVGPEGGFSQSERDHLLTLPFVQAVSLGVTILRAETAAVAGLALLTGVFQIK